GESALKKSSRLPSERTLDMLTKILAGAAMVAALGAVPAFAGDPIVVNAVQFRQLEFEMPANPLTASDAQTGIVETTPKADLASAEATLNGAIAGAPVADAEAILRQAGARCRPMAGGDHATCRYFGVETRDEYVDGVTLRTDLALSDGRVQAV